MRFFGEFGFFCPGQQPNMEGWQGVEGGVCRHIHACVLGQRSGEDALAAGLLMLFGHSVMSDCLWPCGLQHCRPPCPSPSPPVCSNPCPLSQWCHPTVSSSVVPFSSCLQSFPEPWSFLMSNTYIILLFNSRKRVILLMFPLISEKTKAYKDSQSCL